MNPTITLDLSMEDVNQILTALGKEPYMSVFRLIHNIQTQAQAQLNSEATEESVSVMANSKSNQK
jgi:hypothetical protein